MVYEFTAVRSLHDLRLHYAVGPMVAQIGVLTSCFRGDRFLEGFLDQVLNQTIRDHIHLHLRLIQPTDDEQAIVGNFMSRHPGVATVTYTESRESLGASWNRLAVASNEDLLVLWNVDDRRTPNSLELQRNFMLTNDSAGAVYGAFGETRHYGCASVRSHETSPRTRSELLSGMHLGPFFMFRRPFYFEVGGFDEQLMSAADFDFAVRLAYVTDIGHIDQRIGDFLNGGTGLSTSLTGNQPIERTVVELRYGNFLAARKRYVRSALAYEIAYRLVSGSWYPAYDVLPSPPAADGVRAEGRHLNRFSAGLFACLDWLDSRLGRSRES